MCHINWTWGIQTWGTLEWQWGQNVPVTKIETFLGNQSLNHGLSEWVLNFYRWQPPQASNCGERYQSHLMHQIQPFHFTEQTFTLDIPHTVILNNQSFLHVLRYWLKQNGTDCNFNLLHHWSRRKQCNFTFHAKCNSMGSMLTNIKTSDGYIIGDYLNMSWQTSAIN